MPKLTSRTRQTGLTLIELIVFIVIVSVALTGILSVLNIAVRNSADPLVQKQAQALAEGLLEEIELAQFAFCNGSDPDVLSVNLAATGTFCLTACTVPDNYGDRGEGRPFFSVKEYATAARTITAIAATDASGSLAGPVGYAATVWIDDAVDLGGIPVGDALLIRVTVAGPNGVTAVAEGYRTRLRPRCV